MKYILPLCFMVCTAALQADPIYWPASPRLPAKTSEIWVSSEGGKMRNLRLNISGMNIDLTYIGRFAIAPSDSRWNATLTLPELPSIRCGITAFDKGTWLPSLSDGSIKNYILGLQLKGATDITSTVDDSFKDCIPVLENDPKIIEYTLGDIRMSDYLLERNSRLIIFSYEAPLDLYNAQRENARLIFARAIMR